jgi:hypothetical protein
MDYSDICVECVPDVVLLVELWFCNSMVVSVNHVFCTRMASSPSLLPPSSLCSSTPLLPLRILLASFDAQVGFGVFLLVPLLLAGKNVGRSLRSNGRRDMREAHIIAVYASSTLHTTTSTLSSVIRVNIFPVVKEKNAYKLSQ